MSLRDLITARERERSGSTSFITLLDDHLAKPDGQRRRKGYHPSEISYRFCPRLYALLGLGLLIGYKPVSAQLQRVFDNGHYLHDRYQKYTRDMGLVFDHPLLNERGKRVGKRKVAQEVRLEHEVGIVGKCDDMLALDGFLEVVDYKSINPDAFKGLYRPLDYHEKQLTVYLGLTDHLFDGNPPAPLRGRMVYECKGTNALREYMVPWDGAHRQLFDDLVKYLELVNAAIEQNTPDLAPCLCGNCEAYDVEALRAKPKRVKM